MREKTEEYHEFIEELSEKVCHLTAGKNVAVVFQPAPDEYSKDYLVVELDGEKGKHIQRLHTEELFRDLKNGEVNMDQILSNVSEILDCYGDFEKISPLEEIGNYERICSRLIVRPLNYETHAEQLDACVYNRIGDIALVLYVFIGSVREKYFTTKVPLFVFFEWNQEKELVMKAAFENTYNQFPPRIYDLFCLGSALEDRYSEFMEKETLPIDMKGSGGLFITNKVQTNGAVSIFLPGVARKLGELLDSDYYIAFTSMHEAVVHKIGTVEVEVIRSSLSGMNEKLDLEADFLSEQVYKYSQEKDRIEVVE